MVTSKKDKFLTFSRSILTSAERFPQISTHNPSQNLKIQPPGIQVSLQIPRSPLQTLLVITKIKSTTHRTFRLSYTQMRRSTSIRCSKIGRMTNECSTRFAWQNGNRHLNRRLAKVFKTRLGRSSQKRIRKNNASKWSTKRGRESLAKERQTRMKSYQHGVKRVLLIRKLPKRKRFCQERKRLGLKLEEQVVVQLILTHSSAILQVSNLANLEELSFNDLKRP